MSEQPQLVYFRSQIEKEKVNRFFSYWDTLQIAKSLDKENFEKISQEIRSQVLLLLAKGIPDINPLTEKKQKRHVLSVNEIKSHIEKSLGKEIQKPNLYFHLNYMEDMELIQVVDTYGKARNVSSYYGRTAKMFLLGEEKTKSDLLVLQNENFSNFVKKINPQVDETQLQTTIQQILKFTKNDFTQIIAWLDEYMSLFNDLDGVDHHAIFNLAVFLRIQDSEVFEGISSLRKILKLDLDR